ncbi:hypothetical protein V8C35DRAFT_300846 [Trichoderma chlorosporum]
MPSARDPTYLLAPNWTFRSDGPIALGNIIVDPFRPQYPISKLAEALPKTEIVTENNWRFETDKIRTINVSIWTRLFDQVNLKLGPHRQKTDVVKIAMKSVDTIYFRDEPSIQEIQKIASEPRVRSILNADSLFRSPVYMVTGLKIAKGFQLTHHGSSGQGFTVEASESVAPEVSVGGNVNIEMKTTISDGFEAANDIIFAYQLLIIKPKGWGPNMTFRVDDFRHKAALLVDGNSEEDDDDEVEVEFGDATVTDLVEIQEGITDLSSDDARYTWLFQEG